MNWNVVLTILGFLLVQVGWLFHAMREYDIQVARINQLVSQVSEIKKEVVRVEDNTKILDVIIERQNANTRAVERLNDAVRPPTP